MKQHTGTLMLSVSLAVITGLFGLSVTGVIGSVDSSSSTTESAFMLGHVEYIVKGADGNVKSYKQSDNLIVSNGEDCAAKALFNKGGPGELNTDAGNNACKGGLTQGFIVIGLGSNDTAAAAADNQLGREFTGAAGMLRSSALLPTVSMSNSTGDASGTEVTISKTFTNSKGASVIVRESGLFNATTVAADGMFARQTTGDVTVGNGDDLTVEWTINIGGAATLEGT